ncbi:SEC-C metal-binding domain-containing protein [Vibrio europaeus]|uniref:YecA family protein n=1 Tax=Vibrio europaeus TaxID=300876 RepID=UPI0018A7C3F6|nr:SEC-C metal-binding domain-containing protein [Vibrio europaeus]MDC5808831.1 SEC-C metal-binding domain-containing protein [Vibrio europaeus]QPG38082.1 SEC-C domain-containing protein [Vibrio europaeus]
MENESIRSEDIVFKELMQLCSQKGFIHVLAYLSIRDNSFSYSDHIKSDDLAKFSDASRLIRTEISTIQGLILKSGYSVDAIPDELFDEYVAKIDSLMLEIHHGLGKEMKDSFNHLDVGDKGRKDFFSFTAAIRESVYYASEPAYDFQLCELAKQKYSHDKDWLQDNVGFNCDEACEIYLGIQKYINIKANKKTTLTDGYLETFKLDVNEVERLSGIKLPKIVAFLKMFSHNDRDDSNKEFESIDDFNVVNAKPIICLEGEYYLVQLYPLAQSIYESPIFWMRDDSKYYGKHAIKHRGMFTENFALEKLRQIFGEKNVFSNVDIYDKSTRIGEADVLAMFGGKCLLIQAKSKTMTIQARKGNIDVVKRDFAQAVQKAYDQAIICKDALIRDDIILKDSDNNVINLETKPTSVYPICLTSECYPALTMQCKLYLEFHRDTSLNPPFVMDVFLLDVLTEFLDSPLLLLSYIDRRTEYIDRVHASNELIPFSAHLQSNLWLESDNSVVYFDESVSGDLDAAFMNRRLGKLGNKTPKGLLQRLSKGYVGQILKNIHTVGDDTLSDFGLTLLKMSGEFWDMLDKSIDKLIFDTLQDGRVHDISFVIDDLIGGITIHTSVGKQAEAQERLKTHIERRKYIQKAESWIGVLVDPNTRFVSAIGAVSYPWVQSLEVDNYLKKAPKAPTIDPHTLNKRIQVKVGRNDKCTCGSGKKYKKCCLT